MGMKSDSFELGVIVVSVHTLGGKTHIEDWNPRDAAKAKIYAAETSCCGDVAYVDFENGKTGKFLTFKNGTAVAQPIN